MLSSTLALATLISLACLLWLRSRRNPRSSKSIAIVVLGDMGRSPRMMYHADSFAQDGWMVYFIGYRGTPVIPALQTSPNVHLVAVSEPPTWIGKLPRAAFLLFAPFKLLYGTFALLHTLVLGLPCTPTLILVQTPPALPTLPVTQLACLLIGNHLIVDWHNTTYSILSMRLGPKSPVVRLVERLEGFFGRSASAHFFVTNAMKGALQAKWKLRGTSIVFHDRPRSDSHRLNLSESHNFFGRLDTFKVADLTNFAGSADENSHSIFTKLGEDGKVQMRADRPALIVSSTSWTLDEDFGVLLDALKKYEIMARSTTRLPKVIVVVTGRGPLQSSFLMQIATLESNWQFVRVKTTWLTSEDYPKILGAADLGVSLHWSSSGLDLPMKIVDMFGAGLPVLSRKFDCISELVAEDHNGFIFENSSQLAKQLGICLLDFPSSSDTLERLRRGVADSQSVRWGEAWSSSILPVAEQLRKL